MTQIYYLTRAESLLVNLKAEGFSTNHILENCPMPAIGYHMFTADVKRKIGVYGRDYIEFHHFLKKYNAAIAGEHTTPDQTRAIRSYVEGNSLTAIGYLLGITEDDAQRLIDEAAKAAGIFTRDERARRAAMRLYLAIFRPNYAPLTTLENQILRGMAEGKTFEEINEYCPSQNVSFIVRKAKEACYRLNFDTCGRNSQRALLRAFFAWIDAQKAPVTMDDPAF